MDSVTFIPDTDQLKQERNDMVRFQIQERGITNDRVLEIMRQIPRHYFIPPDMIAYAYADRPVPIGFGQTISQPYMVALMTELLALHPTDRVLELGTGSGYQTAILAKLAQEIISIERDQNLAFQARQRLHQLGYNNVTVSVGDGTQGCPEAGSFEAILVTAGGPRIPAPLLAQLAENGRLVCPVGARDLQHLKMVVRSKDMFLEKDHIPCVFVPLVGKEGWPE